MSQDYQVKSVERILTLLKCFQPDRREIPLREFVRLTGMHKSTVYRLLMNLVHQDFVQMTADGIYIPGGELRRLAHLWDDSEVLRQKAHPVLASLFELTGETVFLIEYDNGRGICTDRIEAEKTLKITAQTGSLVPLFKGASGKSIAAFLSLNEREKAMKVQTELYHETYSADNLNKELRKVAAKGYAWTTGEVDEGVSAFAVPLISPQGRVRGSISIAGPSFRFGRDMMESFREKAMERIRQVDWS